MTREPAGLPFRRASRFIMLALACAASMGPARAAREEAPLFDAARGTLYTQDEIWRGFDAPARTPGWDQRVYDQYVRAGKYRPEAGMSRARALHDDGMTQALLGWIGAWRARPGHRGVVSIMGNADEHLRCSGDYAQAVRLGRLLARAGYLVVTGGGPGLMEAANLGAWLADRGEADVERALALLRQTADPKTCGYADHFAYDAAAQAVRAAFPDGRANIGVPTWFYGHEPPNVFASGVAKYFSNAIREDILLAVGTEGVVYLEGSAGMRQEIFQDAAQNHFATYCRQRPMIFLGRRTFGDSGLFALVRRYAAQSPAGDYSAGLTLTDDEGDVVPFLQAHPPRRLTAPDGCGEAF